jgi:hypothetical protein
MVVLVFMIISTFMIFAATSEDREIVLIALPITLDLLIFILIQLTGHMIR